MKTDTQIRMQYAGAIGLLCEASVMLGNGSEKDEMRDSIEQAVSDWCALNGWTYKRILHRIEVNAP